MLMLMSCTRSKPMQMRVRVARDLPDDIKKSEENQRTAGNAGKPNSDSFAQRDADPGHEQTEQRGERGMSGCRASAVITSVLARLHRCARAVRTNGSQWVGIAAWKNAILNPVTAMVLRTELFMQIRLRGFRAQDKVCELVRGNRAANHEISWWDASSQEKRRAAGI